MNKKSKAVKVCIVLVLLLALFSALMIHFLQKKATEPVMAKQYSDAFESYLKQTLDEEMRAEFERRVGEKLQTEQSLDDEGLKLLFLELAQQDAASGFQVTEAGVLSATPERMTMQYQVDGVCLVDDFSLERSDLTNVLYLSGLSETDLVAGGSFRFLEKNRKIVLMLEQTGDSLLLQTVWINANEEKLSIFYKGTDLSYGKSDEVGRTYAGYEDIADLTVCGGIVTAVSPYQDKTHGKLLSVRQEEDGFRIEVEGLAPMEASSDIQVYDLCGEQKSVGLSALTVGYDFTDFVLDDGGRCVAALICRREKMENIRVVLKTEGFEEMYHPSIRITCDTDFDIVAGESITAMQAGDMIEAEAAEGWGYVGRIKIVPRAYTGRVIVHSLKRSQGTPSYRGQMEVEKTESGFLLVNELPLDEYLYSVVPSEMPASYPAEALAAQAVSARSYAYSHMLHSNMQKYGAHVDDSASFQVYNNMNESEATTAACRQTSGEILYYGNEIATTYFYSTSCGYGTDMRAWTCDSGIENGDRYLVAEKLAKAQADRVLSGQETKETAELNGGAAKNLASDTEGAPDAESALGMQDEETFAAFIRSDAGECFEHEDSYFRWYYETAFDEALFWENLQKRFEASKQYVLTKTDAGYEPLPISDAGHVLSMEITRRAEGGAAIELIVRSEKNTYKIMTEKNIRYIMANKDTALKLSVGCGKEGSVSNMLPSAFLTLETMRDEEDGFVTGYKVWGGGFGHGIGMSQNGAKAMAKAGYGHKSILAFFYRDTTMKNINEDE